MSNVIILYILVWIPMFIGLCFLQAFLSSKNKWLGLILPFINITIYLFVFINMMATDGGNKLFIMITIFMNIPTIVYFIIYFIVRKKVKRRSKDGDIGIYKSNSIDEVNKMKIEDL